MGNKLHKAKSRIAGITVYIITHVCQVSLCILKKEKERPINTFADALHQIEEKGSK